MVAKGAAVPTTTGVHGGFRRLLDQLQTAVLGAQSPGSFCGRQRPPPAIWTAFDKNGIGIPFPQRQVYPMEWPPSKEQTHRIGSPTNQLQAEADSDPANDSAGETL